MDYVHCAMFLHVIVRPSVRPSVCLSVCDVEVLWAYVLGHLKLITQIISLGSLVFFAPQSRNIGNLVQGNTPKFGWNRGGVAVLSGKPAISLKRGTIGPRLLLTTNRKSHTCFRLVLKSMTLDDLERPFRTQFHNTCVFRAHHENLHEDRPILSAAEMSHRHYTFWQYKVPWRRGVKRQWANWKRRFSGLSDATSLEP